MNIDYCKQNIIKICELNFLKVESMKVDVI